MRERHTGSPGTGLGGPQSRPPTPPRESINHFRVTKEGIHIGCSERRGVGHHNTLPRVPGPMARRGGGETDLRPTPNHRRVAILQPHATPCFRLGTPAGPTGLVRAAGPPVRTRRPHPTRTPSRGLRGGLCASGRRRGGLRARDLIFPGGLPGAIYGDMTRLLAVKADARPGTRTPASALATTTGYGGATLTPRPLRTPPVNQLGGWHCMTTLPTRLDHSYVLGATRVPILRVGSRDTDPWPLPDGVSGLRRQLRWKGRG